MSDNDIKKDGITETPAAAKTSEEVEKNADTAKASEEVGKNADTESPAVTGADESGITVPERFTVSPNPHMRTSDSTRSIMIDVCIALIPALLWGCFVFGLRSLTVVLLTIFCCVVFEALTQLILRRPVTIGDFSAVVTGMLLGLNLPASIPLWVPVIGAGFAIIIVKQLFGGIGMNIVNPALAARVFLFSWPDYMQNFTEPFHRLSLFENMSQADAVASATPLVSLKSGNLPEVPLFDMLTGNQAGVIGEVSALLLIIGGIYLLIRRVITWHIPVAYIGTVALLSFIFPQAANAVDFMLCEILAGGLMLGAIFMATDYTTSPSTYTGRLIYGCGCGVLTILIRWFGGYTEGVSFAILIMNLFVWYLDKWTRPVRFGGREKAEKKA